MEKRQDDSLLVSFDGWTDKYNMVSKSYFRKYRLTLPGSKHSDLNPKATLEIGTWRGGYGFLWRINCSKNRNSFWKSAKNHNSDALSQPMLLPSSCEENSSSQSTLFSATTTHQISKTSKGIVSWRNSSRCSLHGSSGLFHTLSR